jgi:hypothetical protein
VLIQSPKKGSYGAVVACHVAPSIKKIAPPLVRRAKKRKFLRNPLHTSSAFDK